MLKEKDILKIIKSLERDIRFAEEEFADGFYTFGEDYLKRVRKGMQYLKEYMS